MPAYSVSARANQGSQATFTEIRLSITSQTKPAINAAAAGHGKPCKKRLSSACRLELKRASRSAVPAQYTNAAIHPQRPRPLSTHSYIISAGAAPKETISDKLSYCSPNALCVFVIRAMRLHRPDNRKKTAEQRGGRERIGEQINAAMPKTPRASGIGVILTRRFPI